MHLTRLAREYGGKPAVIMAGSGAVLSYAELDRQSNKIAQLFRSRASCPR
jgi:acyl-CoA synthetase (AMP-forming)/AMP-acid ligase II